MAFRMIYWLLSVHVQVPVAPLQRGEGIPEFPQMLTTEFQGVHHPPEQGIPTMITWNYGGNNLAVEGSWDNWKSRQVFVILLSGIYMNSNFLCIETRINGQHMLHLVISVCRKSLQRSGKDHSVLLVLPSGIYRYKFIVDGEPRYIPDLPFIADEMGHVCNLLDVHVCIL